MFHRIKFMQTTQLYPPREWSWVCSKKSESVSQKWVKLEDRDKSLVGNDLSYQRLAKRWLNLTKTNLST